jgi:integrase
MARIKLKHYVKRKGGRHCYWMPTPKMVAAGFSPVPCGPDGPDAWKIAEDWEARWQAYRRGIEPDSARRYPKDSIGEAFQRFRRTESWAKGRKQRTREDWERGWAYIEPVFGAAHPAAVTFEHLDGWYHKIKARRGVGEAFRAMKTWRALYTVLASMKLVTGADPSLAIRRETPKPRNQVWTAGEVVRLAKGAWRAGYRGLACIIAVAWDTGFAPVDVRTLTPGDAFEAGDDWGFAIDREKTGVAVLGTLSARTQRLILAYLDQLGVAVLPDTPLFRSRGYAPGPKGGRPRAGVPYSKDSLVDDFADVRRLVFGKAEKRRLMDMRRSGAREANAGDAPLTAISAKLGNSIDRSKMLQRTYMPNQLASVRAADEARKKGRRLLCEERNKPKKLKLGSEKS